MLPSSRPLQNGVIVPVITPYHQQEIFRVLDHLKTGGVQSVFLFGTTGEALQLSHQDKLRLMPEVARYLNGSMSLLIGISSPSMDETIELMQAAHAVRAAAAVISPLIVGEDVLKVVHTLLQTCEGELFLYNYPALTRQQFIPLSAISEWVREPRILGIKDSSGDLDYFQQLMALKAQHPSFRVYYGPEQQLRKVIQWPIDGFVPGTGNLEPALACRLWREKENAPWQDWEATKAQILKTNPLYIQGLKTMLLQRGIICSDRLQANI